MSRNGLNNTRRYHVYKDLERKVRTTVSLDEIVATLLEIKFGSSIPEYLQAKLDLDPDPERANVSNWLQTNAILDLVGKELKDAYWEKQFAELEKQPKHFKTDCRGNESSLT